MYGVILALGLAAAANAVPYYGYAPYAYGHGFAAPFYRGGFARFGCGLEPAKPANTHRCSWEAVRNAYGCVVDFECLPVSQSAPPPCPSAPARPETGEHCNWIPIQDKRGCIIDYECEPVTPSPCPPAPVKPDNGGRCKWTPIKDHKDCLIDWECEPLGLPRYFHGVPTWFRK